MAKPAILAVDDDPQVLRAVERDLRRRYYLKKPWDPPDQNLYTNLDELLADYRPPVGRLPLEVGTQDGG